MNEVEVKCDIYPHNRAKEVLIEQGVNFESF